MITQQTQVTIELTPSLRKSAQSKARKSGMPLEDYIENLVERDVEESEYPVFEASDRTIKIAKEALKNKDKAIVVEDIDEFFKNL